MVGGYRGFESRRCRFDATGPRIARPRRTPRCRPRCAARHLQHLAPHLGEALVDRWLLNSSNAFGTSFNEATCVEASITWSSDRVHGMLEGRCAGALAVLPRGRRRRRLATASLCRAGSAVIVTLTIRKSLPRPGALPQITPIRSGAITLYQYVFLYAIRT